MLRSPGVQNIFVKKKSEIYILELMKFTYNVEFFHSSIFKIHH